MTFWLRSIVVPECILKKLNSLNKIKTFFHEKDQNKIHMIAWKNATLSTNKGAWGFSILTPSLIWKWFEKFFIELLFLVVSVLINISILGLSLLLKPLFSKKSLKTLIWLIKATLVVFHDIIILTLYSLILCAMVIPWRIHWALMSSSTLGFPFLLLLTLFWAMGYGISLLAIRIVNVLRLSWLLLLSNILILSYGKVTLCFLIHP